MRRSESPTHDTLVRLQDQAADAVAVPGGQRDDGRSARPAVSRKYSKDAQLDSVRHMFGDHPDADIAAQAGVSVRTVSNYRSLHRIPAYQGPGRKAQPVVVALEPFLHLFGKLPDQHIAEVSGASLTAVRRYRERKHIAPVGRLPAVELERRITVLRSGADLTLPPTAVPNPPPPAALLDQRQERRSPPAARQAAEAPPRMQGRSQGIAPMALPPWSDVPTWIAETDRGLLSLRAADLAEAAVILEEIGLDRVTRRLARLPRLQAQP